MCRAEFSPSDLTRDDDEQAFFLEMDPSKMELTSNRAVLRLNPTSNFPSR